MSDCQWGTEDGGPETGLSGLVKGTVSGGSSSPNPFSILEKGQSCRQNSNRSQCFMEVAKVGYLQNIANLKAIFYAVYEIAQSPISGSKRRNFETTLIIKKTIQLQKNVKLHKIIRAMEETEIRKKLHNYIDQLDGPFLRALYAMIREYSKGEIELSDSEKKAVDEGLADIEKGDVHNHEEVMEKLKKEYPNLHHDK